VEKGSLETDRAQRNSHFYEELEDAKKCK